jgi:hypothetical protein
MGGMGAFGGTGGSTGGTGGSTGGTGGSTGGTGGSTGGTGATGGTGGSTGGTGGTGGYGGYGDDCEIGATDPTCDNCLKTKCYYQCAACSMNIECLLLLDCINSCPAWDDWCVDDCAWYYSGGVNDLLALLGSSSGCLALQCSYECK